MKFDIVDIQNATLAGGVAVGAVADLMLQPYGSFLVGSIAGAVSTLGFSRIQAVLLNRTGLHDTCGVHNLHGIPGLLSGLLSIVLCATADEGQYGSRFSENDNLCSLSKEGLKNEQLWQLYLPSFPASICCFPRVSLPRVRRSCVI